MNTFLEQLLVKGESGDPSFSGPQFLVRGKEESKVLRIARKFINNKEREQMQESDMTEPWSKHTQRKNRENTLRKVGRTKEANGSGGLRVQIFKVRVIA